MPANLAGRSKTVVGMEPTNTNATILGAVIDCKGYEHVLHIINVGVLVAGGYDVKIQDCDTSGGTYTDVTGAAFPSFTASNDLAVYQGGVRVNPARPFQKQIGTETGALTTSFISGTATLHESMGVAFPVSGASSFNV